MNKKNRITNLVKYADYEKLKLRIFFFSHTAQYEKKTRNQFAKMC